MHALVHTSFIVLLMRAFGAQLNNPTACINSAIGTTTGVASAAASTQSAVSNTAQLALDSTGSVVFTASNAVFRLQDDSSTPSFLAGSAKAGHAGDGESIASSLLSSPSSLALLPGGSVLLVFDVGNNVIRAIREEKGTISHWCGNASGTAGYGGDGGQATNAMLSTANALVAKSVIASLSAAPDGFVFLSDPGNNRLRAVSPAGKDSTNTLS
jgi:hypothetical protein